MGMITIISGDRRKFRSQTSDLWTDAVTVWFPIFETSVTAATAVLRAIPVTETPPILRLSPFHGFSTIDIVFQ